MTPEMICWLAALYYVVGAPRAGHYLLQWAALAVVEEHEASAPPRAAGVH